MSRVAAATPADHGRGLFDRLKAAVPNAWRLYTEHPFVEMLSRGELPESSFRAYLIQDYLFLIQFARAKGLAIYKADGLADMRRSAAAVSAIVDREMDLHIEYCAGWGLTEADMVSHPEAPATVAYTRYVLERGMSGDLLDLEVAMSPCLIGYGEIGTRLAGLRDRVARSRHRYDAWIDTYASADYVARTETTSAALDRLEELRSGPGRFDDLVRIFKTATLLEADFWQRALDHPAE